MAVLCVPFISNAQVTYLDEDFNSGWPTGWTTIDNDGLTPHPNVAVFTDAWIIFEDFDSTGVADSVAASNSWYSPAGQADDYMITPQINIGASVGLSWDAQAVDPSFPDGYEVRISTTTPDIAGFMANPPIYTIANASPAWTNISVNLAAAGYSNQNIYLAWRNNSNDQFILTIDNIVVEDLPGFDASVTAVTLPDNEYTRIPIHQSPTISLGGEISNTGGGTVTNARLVVDLKLDGTVVYTDTSAGTTINAAASTTASFPVYTPVDTGEYTAEYHVLIDEMDADPTNNMLTAGMRITGSEYARDDDNQTGGLSIGGGTTGELGHNFEFVNQMDVNSVSLFILNTDDVMLGQPVSVSVYFFTNEPASFVASTDTVIVTQSGAHWITLPMSGGDLTLPSGTFSFIAQEGDSSLTLGTTSSIFTPGAGWVNFPGNPLGGWGNSEDYGFTVAYMLRLNTSEFCSLTASVDNVTNNDCPDDSNGAISITTSGGVGPYTYLWSNGATTEDISGLPVGTYTGTILDSEGCEFIAADIIVGSNDTLPKANISFNITGGQVGFNANSTNTTSYSWDFGDSSDPKMVANPVHTYAANGSYTVTLTATNDCGTSTFTQTVNMETVGLEEDLQRNVVIAPNPNQGVFNVVFTDLKLKEVQIDVYTMAGQRVYQEKLDPIVSSYDHSINLGNSLAKGIYILEIKADDAKIRKRFTLE